MSSWFIRRANVVYSAGGGGRLPAGFTELEYISSDGNPYINTGITYASGNEINCEFMYTNFKAYGPIFGNYIDESHNVTRCILTANNGSVYPQFNCRANTALVTNCTINAKHALVLKSGSVVIDGISNTIYTTQGTANSTEIALFRARVGGSASDIGARIYSFVVKDSGTKVMDLVPAKRNSDNAIGMYDLVSGTFLTNAGSGSFSYGELS